MIPKLIDDIAEADIVALKTAGVEEGKAIEYKRDLPGTRDEDKREFLADVSSFANTEGGDIVYGVEEDQGVITEIVGVALPDFDAEKQRLENLLRDGVSPRINASFRAVPCAIGKLMIARIEKSWNGPHRVIFRGHDKFYARTSAGKFPLDVSQLRTAFLHSATLAEEINGFRLDRIVDIANNRGPISLAAGPRLILHMIPLGAFSGQIQIDVRTLSDTLNGHRAWNFSGYRGTLTFDGFLLHHISSRPDALSNGYSHFYRNGIVEAVTVSLLETHGRRDGNERLIPHQAFEQVVLEYVPRCFRALQSLGVTPPLSVSLSLIGVAGLQMARGFMSLDSGNVIRESNLVIPGAIIDSFSVPPAQILKPMFDRVWNACGFPQSENFDAQGHWAPVRE